MTPLGRRLHCRAMALIAEEIVEEWLRRHGYFTMRGIRLGVHEIDLLAVRWNRDQAVECRHLEVQVSMRPVSFISKIPKRLQNQGRGVNSAKRTEEELIEGVREWVEKKYHLPVKTALMSTLAPGPWTSELVINNVKSEKEVEMIGAAGVKILRLKAIVKELLSGDLPIARTIGGDFIELIQRGGGD